MRRKERFAPFLPAFLNWDICLPLPLDWLFTTDSPLSQSFGLRYTTSAPKPPACRWKIMSQFMVINLIGGWLIDRKTDRQMVLVLFLRRTWLIQTLSSKARFHPRTARFQSLPFSLHPAAFKITASVTSQQHLSTAVKALAPNHYWLHS